MAHSRSQQPQTRQAPLYRDSMDPSRLVRPQGVRAGQAQVRVYFETSTGLNYAGKTQIPVDLFNEDDTRNERVGFTPVAREDVTVG